MPVRPSLRLPVKALVSEGLPDGEIQEARIVCLEIGDH
jgi:hypothetical protein